MRQFFLAYRERIQTPSEFSASDSIIQTPSGFSPSHSALPLSLSHYVRLLTVPEAQARNYYESESLRGGWSVRELDRQIASQAYERQRRKRTAAISEVERPPADYEIRDPFVLEFLNLKDEYSESDLEDALIAELEKFLLELGNDFTLWRAKGVSASHGMVSRRTAALQPEARCRRSEDWQVHSPRRRTNESLS
jgi:hypothetical protein